MPSANEKLEKLQTKIAQLKEQERAIKAREKEKERKARTRRLVQNGALAEKYLQAENLPPEDFEKVLQTLVNLPTVQEAIKKKIEAPAPGADTHGE